MFFFFILFILFTSLILFLLWTVFLFLQLQWTVLQVIQLQLQYWASAMKSRWCHDSVAFGVVGVILRLFRCCWYYLQLVISLLLARPDAGSTSCWFYELLVLSVAGSTRWGCFRFLGGSGSTSCWLYQYLILPVSGSTSYWLSLCRVLPAAGDRKRCYFRDGFKDHNIPTHQMPWLCRKFAFWKLGKFWHFDWLHQLFVTLTQPFPQFLVHYFIADTQVEQSEESNLTANHNLFPNYDSISATLA